MSFGLVILPLNDQLDDEQQRMINLLKQQMMTNLTLMNNLSKQTGIPPARFPIANPAVPNPLLQNMMMPNLMPMAAPNLLANPLANPLLNLQRMQQPPVDPKSKPEIYFSHLHLI